MTNNVKTRNRIAYFANTTHINYSFAPYFDVLWHFRQIPNENFIINPKPWKSQTLTMNANLSFSNVKISIVIPVYNVEQYLRECLDSIINQTMREIQIICVNDGSTDGSLAILREYGALDTRLTVLDQPNRGQSAARNAALSLVQGRYVMFIDSDDWINLDTCEKLFAKAEQTGAEIVQFFHKRKNIPNGRNESGHMDSYDGITGQDITTVEDKIPLFDYNGACTKLWRFDFLRDNHIRFPEGLVFEDQMFCWQGITMAMRVAVVPERLYHYRYNPSSTVIAPENKRKAIDLVPVYRMIGESLKKSGHYDEYREFFIPMKLTIWYGLFSRLNRSDHRRLIQMIRESLTEDDKVFYRSRTALKERHLRFYRWVIDGDRVAYLIFHFFQTLQWLERIFFRRYVFKPMKSLLGFPERTFRRCVIKPIKRFLGGK